MVRLRGDLCQHVIDRPENHLGIVDLNKVPGIRNNLAVTVRGESSVGVMRRREHPEKRCRLLTHVGGYIRRHGVTSGGQHDQRHLTIAALGIDYLAPALRNTFNRRSLRQEPCGIGIELSKGLAQS